LYTDRTACCNGELSKHTFGLQKKNCVQILIKKISPAKRMSQTLKLNGTMEI